MATVTVTNDNFQSDVLGSDTPVVVDFWAEWCGPCKMIAPALDELATEFDGKVKIAKINIDENPDIAAQYGVRSIPTLYMFKGGEVVDQMVGAAPKGKLSDWMQNTVG
ncbi:MAG: thioredoxin [Pseudomonadota bacterium]